MKAGIIQGETLEEQGHSALKVQLISQEEFHLLQQAEAARQEVIAVDDFSLQELLR